jgi:hypothetical protein
MRSLACFALVIAVPLAFSTGCAGAPTPAISPADYAANGPPVGWRDPSVGKETRSGAMVVTGAVLISVAATMLPIGTVMASAGGQDCITDPSGNSFTCTADAGRISGLGVLAAAAGGLAVGLPLVVLGAQKVPIEIPRRAALTVGPTGAALRYDF